MDEPAALITLTADLHMPPVTDVFRDEEFEALEGCVGAAEEAVREGRYDDAVTALNESVLTPLHCPDLEFRGLLAAGRAQLHRGELGAALTLLRMARELAQRPGFNDVDRAQVLHLFGCLRGTRGATTRALRDFSLALELCDRSGRPCDELRAEIAESRALYTGEPIALS